MTNKNQWMILDRDSGTFFRASDAIAFDWNSLTEEQEADIESCGEISEEILRSLKTKDIVLL